MAMRPLTLLAVVHLHGETAVASPPNSRRGGTRDSTQTGLWILPVLSSEPARLEAAELWEQAMSEENVETLRRIAAAWNRRDLDVWLGFMHPEIEWVPARKRLEGGAYRGHSGMREYMADSDVDDSGLLMVEIDEVRDLGNVAVGLGHVQGESARGIPVNTQYGVVIGFRDGLAVSGSTWFSHAEALEAAGLRG